MARHPIDRAVSGFFFCKREREDKVMYSDELAFSMLTWEQILHPL